MTYAADLAEFHRQYDLFYDGPPRALPDDLQSFRIKFLREELEEYMKAVNALHTARLIKMHPDDITLHLADALDALVDLVYVALGTAQFHGFDFHEAWQRVHEVNMTQKRRANGDGSDSKRGTSYDVVKIHPFTPPDHTDLVREHAHGGTNAHRTSQE
jgi:predicted HAD superfamily Cof-like phosphohydrolase